MAEMKTSVKTTKESTNSAELELTPACFLTLYIEVGIFGTSRDSIKVLSQLLIFTYSFPLILSPYLLQQDLGRKCSAGKGFGLGLEISLHSSLRDRVKWDLGLGVN